MNKLLILLIIVSFLFSAPSAFSKEGGDACGVSDLGLAERRAPAAGGEAETSAQGTVNKEADGENITEEQSGESQEPAESSKQGIEQLSEDEWDSLPEEP